MSDKNKKDICDNCGSEGEYQGDTPTNRGATAIDPHYKSVYKCSECENEWLV